jgi:hypothetical protein
MNEPMPVVVALYALSGVVTRAERAGCKNRRLSLRPPEGQAAFHGGTAAQILHNKQSLRITFHWQVITSWSHDRKFSTRRRFELSKC